MAAPLRERMRALGSGAALRVRRWVRPGAPPDEDMGTLQTDGAWSIAVANLVGKGGAKLTQELLEVLSAEDFPIDAVPLDPSVRIRGEGTSPAARLASAEDRARDIILDADCHALAWGETLGDGEGIRLRIVAPVTGSEAPFGLAVGQYIDIPTPLYTFTAVIQAALVAAASPWPYGKAQLTRILRPLIGEIEGLLDSPPIPLSAMRMAQFHGVAGFACVRMDEAGAGSGWLARAAMHYDEALDGFAARNAGLPRAGALKSLAAVHQRLGRNAKDNAHYEQAALYYGDALELYDPEVMPLEWSAIQSRLGDVLMLQAKRPQARSTCLSDAAAAYHMAVEAMPKDAAPARWGAVLNGLGAALKSLGEQEGGTELLKTAVSTCRTALEYRSREAEPLGWAATQSNLGGALFLLGKRSASSLALSEAAEAYTLAASEYASLGETRKMEVVRRNAALVARTMAELRSGNPGGAAPSLEAKPKRELSEDILPFLSELEQILEEPPPRAMRAAHYFVMAMLVVLFVIAAVFDVDIVVSGTGRLVPDAPPIVLQPMERAIIRDLKVKAGDVVTRGQVLATLDPTFTQADLASLTAQERALVAQTRRLEAELQGVAFVPASPPEGEETLQIMLYQQRQAQYASRLRSFDEDVRRFEANIRRAESNRASYAQEVAIAKDTERMRASLLQSQLGTKLQYQDTQTNRMHTERGYSDTLNSLAESQHLILGKQAERQAFIEDWRRQLLEELVRTRTELSKIEENITKAARLRDLVVITAPEDGIVLDVAKRSEGSVMREAEPLVTLIRSGTPLIAEIMIGSSDVGYTSPGDDTKVKVDAFPFQRHGYLEGKLHSVSEDSFSQNGQDAHSGGGIFHRVQIRLTKTKLDQMPKGARLIPGMSVTAEIKVGSRSVISYFLNPITKGLSEGMKEP